MLLAYKLNFHTDLLVKDHVLFFNRLNTVLFPPNELFSLANRNMKQVFFCSMEPRS